MSQPKLSICIPTFNRANLIGELVKNILGSQGDFEICVHIDGSTDNTLQLLSNIINPRLRVSSGDNRGRGNALYTAVAMAHGKFILIFDDDDMLTNEGIKQILADCSLRLPVPCSGFIYQMADDNGQQVGSNFPVERSNFMALRADHAVTGDKKEVVLADLLRSVMEAPSHRRVPTSLYWSRLGLRYDVICRNISIGRKNYLSEGMTSNIRSLKGANVDPLVSLYITHLRGFLGGRYRSLRFALRSLVALVYYFLRGVVNKVFK